MGNPGIRSEQIGGTNEIMMMMTIETILLIHVWSEPPAQGKRKDITSRFHSSFFSLIFPGGDGEGWIGVVRARLLGHASAVASPFLSIPSVCLSRLFT